MNGTLCQTAFLSFFYSDPLNGKPLLPDAAKDSFVACPPYTAPCFLAGDIRVNEQAALTAMHTIWLREHNRIASYISDKGYPPGQVFDMTRKIVAAEIQKITYKDFLPILLGSIGSAALIPKYEKYDPSVDPRIPNGFATAAYRFGHSMIQPFFERLDKNYTKYSGGPLPLVDAFFDTSHVREHGTDPLIRGLLQGNAREVDEYLNSQLTHQLFAHPSDAPGMDLASLNIQRGRDHGLPSYLTWKEWAEKECNGIKGDFRHSSTLANFFSVYKKMANVDLFAGGLAEKPHADGLVGAVFACIISKTFTALRDGDRFFYENPVTDSSSGGFTSTQIRELNKHVSLSRVICDNTGIEEIQINAFLAGDDDDRVLCTDILGMKLDVFIGQSDDEVDEETTGEEQTADTLSEDLRDLMDDEMALMEKVLQEIEAQG